VARENNLPLAKAIIFESKIKIKTTVNNLINNLLFAVQSNKLVR